MEVLPRSRGSQMRQKTNAAAAYGYWGKSLDIS